jgi:phosphoribosylformylglycinamidine (FGAM) synthase-like enzyme
MNDASPHLNAPLSLSTLAIAAWQAASALRAQAPALLDIAASESFLLLICPQSAAPSDWEHLQNVATVLRGEGGIVSAIERSTGGLWVAGARWALASRCHVYLNLDLLTIDPHAQDWGDFKIKPEQVEVQRSELTLKALFDETPALLVQVRKHELGDVMQALRAAGLAQNAFTVGKPWAAVEGEAAKIEVFRDAKKQLAMTAADFEFKA